VSVSISNKKATAERLRMAFQLLRQFGDSGRIVWQAAKTVEEDQGLEGVLAHCLHGLKYMRRFAGTEAVKYHRPPVDVVTFIRSPEMLNMGTEVYPKIMDEIADLCFGDYVESVWTGGIGCVDADTEYLSPTGWRRIADYDGGAVAQYDPETGQAEFVEPEDWVRLECNQFYHLRTKYGIDQALSPEHRVLYRDRSGALKVIVADELVKEHGRLAKGFHGKLLTTFEMDGSGLDLSDDELRVQVMAMADGSFNKDRPGRACLVAVKRKDKIVRARQLLASAGAEWTETPRPGGGVRFYFQAPLREKSMGVFWGASREQCDVILSEALMWDARSDNRRQLFSTDKATVDFLQYAACVLGLRSTVGVDRRPEQATCYTLTLSTNTEVSLQGVPKTPIETIPSPDGYKYCFSVPKTFWVMRRNGRVAITGNTGKTTAALIVIAYHLYLLSCLKNPHREFGLAPSSEIVFIFQSLKKEAAKGIDFMRFKSMLDSSPYFQNVYRYDRGISSQLNFPNRVIVMPLSGDVNAAIGQNVFGGVIDEVNFMAVIEKSKSSSDGGTFDQANEMYNGIVRRRKSRFMAGGKLPGMLCLVSSKRYPGEFTDRKMEEAQRDKTIFIYDKRVWDVKPEGTFSGEWFNLFVGDVTRKPRLLGDDEEVTAEDRHLIMQVPDEYRSEFERDMLSALRDIAGVSTLALHPFILNSESVVRSFGRAKGIAGRDRVDFKDTKLQIFPKRIINPDEPRFAHLDLAISGDSCGLAIGHVTGFEQLVRGEKEVEILPRIYFDLVLEIAPPRQGEIEFEKVRSVLYRLREMGMNIKWVTLDSYQSTDTIQLLAQRGFITGLQSMDTSTQPYDMGKQAFYDDRVDAPDHEKAMQEWVRLERDPQNNKIDHPPKFSKDCSDAMAGVIYGLTRRREIWVRHKVPMLHIPESVRNPQVHKRSIEDKESQEA
jgi:hypothetical protein